MRISGTELQQLTRFVSTLNSVSLETGCRLFDSAYVSVGDDDTAVRILWDDNHDCYFILDPS